MNATLGELISPAPTIRCGESEYPVLSMTMHDGIVLQSDRFNKRLASADTSNYKVVKRGQLVIGFPINEGVIYPQKTVDAGIMSPAYNVWNIDQTAVDIDYLEYCLHSPASMNYYASKLRGSTARRRSMPTEHLLELPIPLPSLPTQRCIAAALDKAQSLISVRREQIAVLEKLAKDLFVEMFGDPCQKQAVADVRKISQIADVCSGSTPSRDKPEYFTGTIPWVKTGEVCFGEIFDTEEHITQQAINDTSCKLLPVNTILIAMYGQGKTRGQSAILRVEAATNQACAAIKPSSGYNSDYLFQYIKMSYEQLRNQARGGNQPNINLGMVKGLEVIIPSIPLQERYGNLVSLINKQKDCLQASLAELEALYKSLTQRAFAGELFSD